MGQIQKSSYTDDYRRLCFSVWYEEGKPSFSDLALLLPKFDNNMSPNTATLRKWYNEDGWLLQADELDKDVEKEMKKRLVGDKVAMLERHSKIGQKLQELGLEYFETNGITSQNSALRALQQGVEMEAEAANLEKILSTVSSMDDGKLLSQLNDLLDKTKVIDVESVDPDDTE